MRKRCQKSLQLLELNLNRNIKNTRIETMKKIRKVHMKCFFQIFATCIYFPLTEKNISNLKKNFTIQY